MGWLGKTFGVFWRVHMLATGPFPLWLAVSPWPHAKPLVNAKSYLGLVKRHVRSADLGGPPIALWTGDFNSTAQHWSDSTPIRDPSFIVVVILSTHRLLYSVCWTALKRTVLDNTAWWGSLTMCDPPVTEIPRRDLRIICYGVADTLSFLTFLIGPAVVNGPYGVFT
jgi:hypothetical protein